MRPEESGRFAPPLANKHTKVLLLLSAPGKKKSCLLPFMLGTPIYGHPLACPSN